MDKHKLFIFTALCMVAMSISLNAAYTIKNGWIADANRIATLPAQEHYELGLQALKAEDWEEGAKQFMILSENFPKSPYGQEALYYLGVCHFYMQEYDLSNDAFTSYLHGVSNPRFFQQSVEYKYQIAERFKDGAKRRILGTKKLPKWASGQSLGLKIYDEVIAAVPSHELAARALISKGLLHWDLKEYKDAVDAFQMVIRRFPKSEFAPECYLYIAKVYLDQSRYEFQNPDLLAFAQINLRKFKQDFPRESRLNEAEQNVLALKEIYAQGLYDTGQFYERTNRPSASIIYYHNAIKQFPDTHIAEMCKERLSVLIPNTSGRNMEHTQPS